MADMTVLDYAMMVEDSHVETRIIEYRKRNIDTGITGRGEELIAVALTDVLSDGLSMVYSFFEPSEHARSLGTFMILDHITRARRLGLPYVYLGYWIEGSRRWITKAASCRSNGWRPQAGSASTRQAKCRPSRRIELSCPRRRASSTPRLLDSTTDALEYWVVRSSRTTTVVGVALRLPHQRVVQQLDVQRHDDCSNDPRHRRHGSRNREITHLAAIGDESHQRDHRDGNCIDRITWLNTSNSLVPRSP